MTSPGAFKLQVVAKKPKKGKKAKPESAVAKAKVKAGRSAILSLKPTKAGRGAKSEVSQYAEARAGRFRVMGSGTPVRCIGSV